MQSLIKAADFVIKMSFKESEKKKKGRGEN